jgi:hypothetical protein
MRPYLRLRFLHHVEMSHDSILGFDLWNDELISKLGTDQFAPTPDEATFVRRLEIVPSHFEFNREYRSPMGAKSHPAMRNVDYPDPTHALTGIEEQQTSTAGDTAPGD